MHIRLDPAILVGKPWTMRVSYEGAKNDWVVMCAGHRIGRISLGDAGYNNGRWMWSITGPLLPEKLRPGQGTTDSLDEAKTALRTKFEAWLHYAIAQGDLANWHE